jgi:hypothetical protein
MLKKLLIFIGLTIMATLACQTVSRLPELVFATAMPSHTPATESTPNGQVDPLRDLSYADRPDDFPDQYQIHVFYVVPKNFTDTTRYFDGSIDENMRLMNTWFADQTGGRSFTLDTYQGSLDITYIPLPATEEELFDHAKSEYGKYDVEFDGKQYLSTALEDYLYQMKPRPFQPRKIYVAYVEISQAYRCGTSQSGYGFLVAKVFPGAYSLQDAIDCEDSSSQWRDGETGYWEHLLAHEVIHLLGFPNGSQSACSSHRTEDLLHIFDPQTPNDIMEQYIGENPVLDPNHDDYYLLDKPCLDLADSPYLSP